MCFSAEASFTAGFVLVGAGIIAATQIRSKGQLLLGITPFLFAIQQFIEGFQWVNINSRGSHEISQLLAYSYLFFALFLWPVYLPIAIFPFEKNPKRKKWILADVILGILFICVSGYWFSDSGIKAENIGHHLSYFKQNPKNLDISVLYFSIYYAITAFPVFVVQVKNSIHFRILGILGLISLCISYFVSTHGMGSVWCFCIAILSIYIIVILKKIEIR